MGDFLQTISDQALQDEWQDTLSEQSAAYDEGDNEAFVRKGKYADQIHKEMERRGLVIWDRANQEFRFAEATNVS